MSFSHSDIVKRFNSGATSGMSSHMFIEGDTLYSYGHHFPLLVRRDFGYVLNGDKYSVTTSGHQSHCRGIATVVIPFSALQAARINPRTFTLVNKTDARVDERQYRAKDGTMQTAYERRPESALLAANGKYYLSGMDSERYFIVELPRPCETCEQAYDMLIPEEARGHDYQRQGEWFVFPVETPQSWQTAKKMYRAMTRDYVLPHKDSGNPHIATRGLAVNGIHYISGQLKHPEHKMLHLSTQDNPVICQAWVNTAVNSWSASGRID